MTNLDIDKKLAQFLHPSWYLTTVANGKTKKAWKQFVDPKGNELVDWNPSEDMGSAWEVAERFGLTDLRKETTLGEDHWFAVFSYESIMEFGKTAPLAICKAALKVIEGSKSDE